MTKATILIVDDEPFNVDYLEQELEELDCETVSAANGLEALEKVQAISPDLVLLDIMMPVMDGFETLRRLKAEPAWRDIPVVVISALTDTDSVVRGIQLGADDYLPKPFDPILLAARISAGLVRKRLRDLEKLHLQSLEREMAIGHQLQAGFLPGALPEISGWNIAAHFQAAREVAGDFYDAFCLSDGRLGFFLGDVTDKGVGSALFMALYRSLLRVSMIEFGNLSAVDEPTADSATLLLQAVTRTNHYVCRTHRNALFATLFIGLLDLRTGRLDYVNAGHNPPRLLKREGGGYDLEPTGPLIGAFDWMEYAAGAAELGEGDALLVYSDGVEDTENDAGEFYGRERLLALAARPANSASDLVSLLATSLAHFMGRAKPVDDVTVLAIMRHAEFPSLPAHMASS